MKLVQDFWRAEEISVGKKSYSPDEQVCEEFYQKTTRQNETGQYIVSLPWKSRDQLSSTHLENSHSAALRALNRLGANFAKDEQLKLAYIDFIKEYIDLGHISLTSNSDSSSNTSQAFLPHHGVWKETSTPTKLRTVFNGSSKTKSGVSVNDLLHVGPNLLQNPVALICAWRRYKIALSADVEKMFRRIGVEPVNQPYQSILWRFDKSEPIQTYGLACSLFLAIRTLLKLTEDYSNTYRIAADAVRTEMYSDNVLSGAHSLEEALLKQDELIQLFKQGHLNLQKWTSNSTEVLSYLPSNMLATDSIILFASETSVPILGIDWQPNTDYFSFHIEDAPSNLPFTKRSVLPRITRIFDSMGWLAPIVITAKIIMQSLWILKVSWDEELPLDISSRSQTWLQDLHFISLIKIPRWSGYTSQCEFLEIHGFADASIFAYDAVIYLRLIQNQNVLVTLQVAKTRVAPVKTLSIPRLELFAALLLARLTHTFIESFPIKIESIHLWSDSADVLFWLKDHPSRWGVFVANRCSEIHTLLPDAYWHHVSQFSAHQLTTPPMSFLEELSLQN